VFSPFLFSPPEQEEEVAVIRRNAVKIIKTFFIAKKLNCK
jgi:hypothetical protein